MFKKIILYLFRFTVGVLFIFSGLIKVNDPIGTSIKLEEYFDVFSHDIAPFFDALKAVSLPLSVFLIVLEVALGVALIIGVKRKWTISLLLIMILFFTFLTFYSAYFNKVTDCGCFGDAIKLTPWQSLYKDIILLIMITVLFLFQKDISDRKSKVAFGVVLATLILTLGGALWTINNLPFIDFRAYKEGVNIPTAMEPSAELRYLYLMKKEGEEVLLESYPSDESYEFVDMQLQNPEVLPKISDFSIWNEEGDFTDEILTGNKLLVLISNFEKMDGGNLDKLSPLLDQKEMEVVIITASSSEEMEGLKREQSWNFPYYYGDATVIKTMIRSNPGIILLKEGTIIKKYHHRNIPSPETLKRLLNQ